MKKLLFSALVIFLPVMAYAQRNNADSSVSQGAGRFVDQFWSKWSSPNAEALPYIQSVIDDPVIFYGKSIPRDAYMKVQTAFSIRWPDRQYSVQTGSEEISCGQGTSICRVSGIVDWKDSSPERNSISTGSARFSFSVRQQKIETSVVYRVAAEGSSVITRNFGQITANSTTTVPFVGCEDTDQDFSPPTGKPVSVNLPSNIASKLAAYVGNDGLLILAPRGWNCVSSTPGAWVYVTPNDPWNFFAPPSVYVRFSDMSDPQNWNETDALAVQLFPKVFTGIDLDYIQPESSMSLRQWIQKGMAPKIPRSEHLKYLNGDIVEFTTPSERLKPSSAAYVTNGFYGLFFISNFKTPMDDLKGATTVSVTLPDDFTFLTKYILDFSEKSFEKGNHLAG